MLRALRGKSYFHPPFLLLLAAAGLLLLLLSASASPAAARYDCDPFEGGSPQSSKKCPCSDEPSSRYYCASAVQYTVFEGTEKVRALFLSLQETAGRAMWLAARLVASLAQALLGGQVWQTIREGVLEQLQSVMGGPGGVLARVTGGGNGLFLVALLLSGLSLAFPLLGATRLVQPDRALLWGVVLSALFIAGARGFDLTDAIEALRVQMIEAITESEAGSGLTELVAAPVGATPEEARQLESGDLMTLPRAMVREHFIGLPEGSRCQGEGGGADECQKYRVIAFETNIAGQDLEYMFTAVKYKPDVIAGRQRQYTGGLVRMGVAFLASAVLMLFGLVFALLTAASLVLIIFFFAMLPLGFFEFGGAVLSGLMRQYTSVVGLSLFAAVMVRLMGGITGIIFGAVSDFSDVLGLLTYLGMLLIIGLGLQMAVRTAWGLVDGTFTVLRTSVQTVGSLAFALGGGPVGRAIHAPAAAARATGGALINTALAAGAGLAAGGLGGAFAAGAGGLLARTHAGGRLAEAAEAAAPASLGTRLFTTAARSPGGWQSALGLAAVGRRQRDSASAHFHDGLHSASAQTESLHVEASRLHPRWGAVDRGAYLTTDLNLIQSAEQAYFQRRSAPEALSALERAFGSRALADEALGAYEVQGRAGARQVRRVIEVTQAAAEDWTQRGRALFDDRGRLSASGEAEILQALRQAGLYAERKPQDSAFVGRLAGAALRRPAEVWADPGAAQKLARDTFDPEGVEVQVEDVPAQAQLRELARQLGWDQAGLAGAFAAIPQARGRALGQGRPLVSELVQAWRENGLFPEQDDPTLSQAARLALLVSAEAQSQQPRPLPSGRADVAAPLAEVSREPGCVVLSTPYSADLAGQFESSFSGQDCWWNLDQGSWNVAPGQEAAALQILERVAAENGWQVLEAQPGEAGGPQPPEPTPDGPSAEHPADESGEAAGSEDDAANTPAPEEGGSDPGPGPAGSPESSNPSPEPPQALEAGTGLPEPIPAPAAPPPAPAVREDPLGYTPFKAPALGMPASPDQPAAGSPQEADQ